MTWNHGDTPLLAKALEAVVDGLPEDMRTAEHAAIMRNAIRDAIRGGTHDLKALIEVGARAIRR